MLLIAAIMNACGQINSQVIILIINKIFAFSTLYEICMRSIKQFPGTRVKQIFLTVCSDPKFPICCNIMRLDLMSRDRLDKVNMKLVSAKPETTDMVAPLINRN